MNHPRTTRSGGFTLIEVILALAILGGALAVLGEIWRIAGRSAADAEAETRAQILAESLLDRLLAGDPDVVQGDRQALETDDDAPWLYSLKATTAPLGGLEQIEVVVEQDLEPEFNPVKFRLVRWVPAVAEPNESQEEAEFLQASGVGQSTTSTTSSSTSNSSSTSGSAGS